MFGPVLALAAILTVPLQPVSYSWTIAPVPPPPFGPERWDTCHVSLRATEATNAMVKVFFFRGVHPFIGYIGATIFEPMSAGQTRVFSRLVPYDAPCPCLACATQYCPNGMTHTQCGYVLRPGDPPGPSGWTPFSQIGLNPVCVVHQVNLLSDGFESGNLSKWAKYP